MSTAQTPTTARWVRATWLGWLLAVPIVAGFALVGEAIGIGGAQVLVGAGLGTAVGLCQARLLAKFRIARVVPWTVASAVGLALPFLMIDILRALTGDSASY